MNDKEGAKIFLAYLIVAGVIAGVFMHYDAGSQPVKVHIEGELTEPWTMDDPEGHYNLTLPAGRFSIDVEAPSRYWKEAVEDDNCFWTGA